MINLSVRPIAIPALADMSANQPRVLAIGTATNANGLPAVYYMLKNWQSQSGKVASVKLPYPTGHFTVVRIDDVLVGLAIEQQTALLTEAKRVLHRYGVLMLVVPQAGADSVSRLLRRTGFSRLRQYKINHDLAALSGIDKRRYQGAILLAARRRRPRNYRDSLLTKSEFRASAENFRKQFDAPVTATYVVPVHNEAKTLPHFLKALEACTNTTGSRREFIFVANDCSDGSEDIIGRHIVASSLDIKLITSEKGIMKAMLAGIKKRSLHGFVGKIDADMRPHPHCLDLMEMELVEKPGVQVTYADPVPRGEFSIYSEPAYKPDTKSLRLGFIAQTCLFRQLPPSEPGVAAMLPQLNNEELFMNFYYAYFYGLDSITRTARAQTYSKTVDNFDDLVTFVSRFRSDMQRVGRLYPPFRLLDKVFAQDYFSKPYGKLLLEATKRSEYTEEWKRLESTK